MTRVSHGLPGIYNASPLTLSDGDGAALALNQSGQLIVAAPTGTDANHVQGNTASGTTDAGNPVKVGAVYNATAPTVTTGQRVDLQATQKGWLKGMLMGSATADTVIAGRATDADGVAVDTSINSLSVAGRNYTFNGTTYDRVRSVITGANTTGTGITATGIMAQLDDVATTSVTENQFANLRITTDRSLMVNQVFSCGRATADTQIKGSAGFIHTVTISPTGSVTAGVLTVYDSTTESGTVLMSIALPVTTFTPFSVTLDVNAATGIYVGFDATLANVQATVSYR